MITLDETLSIKQSTKRKYEKTWIIINLVYNANGSQKCKSWFIGITSILCCFGRSSINIKNFCMVWRSNKKT